MLLVGLEHVIHVNGVDVVIFVYYFGSQADLR